MSRNGCIIISQHFISGITSQVQRYLSKINLCSECDGGCHGHSMIVHDNNLRCNVFGDDPTSSVEEVLDAVQAA